MNCHLRDVLCAVQLLGALSELEAQDEVDFLVVRLVVRASQR